MSINPDPDHHHRVDIEAEQRRILIERLIQQRIGELERIEHVMQGGHEYNYPCQKSHLTYFEMCELDRVNRWRSDFNRLMTPTPSMYEASRLMRYVHPESPADENRSTGDVSG